MPPLPKCFLLAVIEHPCAIFNNFDANKGDLIVVGKFNRERKTGVKTVKGSKKIDLIMTLVESRNVVVF